jgi:hypothetical protein
MKPFSIIMKITAAVMIMFISNIGFGQKTVAVDNWFNHETNAKTGKSLKISDCHCACPSNVSSTWLDVSKVEIDNCTFDRCEGTFRTITLTEKTSCLWHRSAQTVGDHHDRG